LTDDDPRAISLGISKAYVFVFGANYQEKSKRRTNKHVNFQAESVARPPDAAGTADRPDQAIISTHPIWPARH
jgi:hypothetical protein